MIATNAVEMQHATSTATIAAYGEDCGDEVKLQNQPFDARLDGEFSEGKILKSVSALEISTVRHTASIKSTGAIERRGTGQLRWTTLKAVSYNPASQNRSGFCTG